MKSEDWNYGLLDVRRCSGLDPPTNFEVCGKQYLNFNEATGAVRARASPPAREGRPDKPVRRVNIMRWSVAMRFTVFLVSALMTVLALCALAWAQASPSPLSPTGENVGRTATIVVVLIVLLVILGVAVKLYDLRRKREAEGLQLQAQLSDALMREPGFSGLGLAATVHVATFRKSPPIVAVSGHVPTPDMRERALAFVRAEATRNQPDVQVEDRIAIVPAVATRVG